MAKGTFGERLKRERELREVTLAEVSKSTRISERFLQALEEEDWPKLPGGVFGRGFVRTVARYLGLSEEALLSEYDLARGENLVSASPKPEDRIPSPPRWIPVIAVLVILLLLAGLVLGAIYSWKKFKTHRLASHASAALSTEPSPSLPSTAASLQSASQTTPDKPLLQLSLSTSSPTHVRVLADDVAVLDSDLPAGETRHFSASTQFEVSASDSAAVLLELNGVMMPPIGSPGSSGKIALSAKDLRQTSSGVSQP